MKRPDVFDYLDHQTFLKDWLAYLKEEKKIGMRQLAASSGISASSISLCISQERKWTLKLVGKLLPYLELKKSEQEAVRLLLVLGTTEDPMERLSSFDELRRLPGYSAKQRDSSTVYLYLRHWLNVTIRELVYLNDFQAEVKWIRERLRYMPSEAEVERSLKFLIKEQYIRKEENGRWVTAVRNLDCQEGVFKLSLGEYHRQVLQLAQRSIEEVPRELRFIMGHTAALNGEQKKKAEEILKQALTDIQNLNANSTDPENLFQFEFIMIPLTQKGDAV